MHVLAHHVYRMRENLETVDGAPSVPRIVCSMGSATEELDRDVDDGLRALGVRARLVIGMPGQHDIDTVHHSFAQHVELSTDRLLGWRAEELHGSMQLARSDQLLDCCRGGQACDTE